MDYWTQLKRIHETEDRFEAILRMQYCKLKRWKM